MNNKKYIKILCGLKISISIFFLIISLILWPMTVLLPLVGVVLLIKGIYDLVLMLKKQKSKNS